MNVLFGGCKIEVGFHLGGCVLKIKSQFLHKQEVMYQPILSE
jgi:hypothetical protein